MKKLSLMIVFVMLLVAVLAFSASAAFTRGEEGQTITMDNVESIELISGSNGHGSPANVMDGTGAYWGGPAGSEVKITFINEWEISEMSIYLIQNWSGCKITIYAADGTQIGGAFQEGSQTYNTDYIWGGDGRTGKVTDLTSSILNKVTYGDSDPAVKYVILKATQDKWGYLPGFVELNMVGRERIPSEGCEEHSFISVEDPAPTCTESGYIIRICENCGAEEAPTVAPALGHVYDSYTVLPPETCLGTPKIQFECTRCGEVATKDNHIQDVTDYADLSTVYVEGSGGWTNGTMFDNDMGKYQQASSGWYVLAEVELDQAYYLSSATIWTGFTGGYSGDWIMTLYYMAPDGTEWIAAGTKQVPPTDYSITWAPAGEHTLVLDAPVYAKAVKIRVDGITHASGIVFEAEIAGSLLPDTIVAGHQWEAGEVVEPTCVYRGYTNYVCAVCGETKMDSFVNFTNDHKYEIEVEGTTVDPTCTEKGSITMQCTTCTGTKNVSIDALGHDLSEATCTEAATCQRENCDYVEGEALGHTEVDIPPVEVTCTENGLTAGKKCEVCGTITLEQDVVEAEGHDMQDATCEFPSMCSVCGYTDGEPLPHNIVHVDAKAGTDCQTWDGNIEYWYCADCGYAWEDEALTKVTNQMSIKAAGEHSYFYPCDVVCMVCYQETNTNAKHNIVYVEEVEATCLANGNIEYWYCSDCGYAWADEELTQVTNRKNVITVGDHAQAWDWSDEETGYVGAYEWVNATCKEAGYVKDKCLYCNEVMVFETFPIDEENGHVVVEGSYVQVDATCNADGSFSYDCAVCEQTITGTIDADPYAHAYDNGSLVDNKLVYTCTTCGATEEHNAVVITVGDNTVNFPFVEDEWLGSHYDSIYVIITTPGSYTISSADVWMDYVEARNISTWVDEFPFAFEVAEGGFAMFLVTPSNDMEQETALVTIAEAGCKHANTAEIPAVLPTPSSNGTTAGVKCLDCDEVIVAPVENNVTQTPSYKTFGINSTNLILGNNISLDYKVNVSAGYEILYMVFVFEGNEYVVYDYEIDGGKPLYNFAETRPHKMAETVSAYVYAKTADGYSYDVYDYSVMKYCIAKLKKNENVNVISDLLAFGAATQKYVNSSVADEDLITSLIEAQGYTLTPTAFTSIPAALKAQYVDVDADDDFTWKSSTVVLGSSTEMVYKFAASDITGLQIKIEVDGVEKMMLDASDLTIENGRYVVSVNCVSAVQYGSEVKATFVINGVESDSVAYSINGFLYNNLSKNEGTALGDLMKALYVYGDSTYNLFYGN